MFGSYLIFLQSSLLLINPHLLEEHLREDEEMGFFLRFYIPLVECVLLFAEVGACGGAFESC